jgi:hypothetical protein
MPHRSASVETEHEGNVLKDDPLRVRCPEKAKHLAD